MPRKKTKRSTSVKVQKGAKQTATKPSTKSSKADTPVNKREIRLVGMRNGGLQSVAAWLIAHTPGKLCYLNNIDVEGNPFEKAAQSKEGEIRFWPANYDIQAELDGLSKKDLILYSYEQIKPPKIPAGINQYIGESSEKLTVLVLCDVFSQLANALLHEPALELENILNLKEFLNIWKSHAYEALNVTEYLGEKVFVQFNKWANAPDYHRQSRQALLPGYVEKDETADDALHPILRYPIFFPHVDEQRAEVHPLTEWKKVVDHPAMHYVLKNDEEAMYLTSSIFPFFTHKVVQDLEKKTPAFLK